MDFHSMKRKDLQGLCKKHKIPANLSNLEMANRLTEFFKENENSVIQGLINGQDENASESESTNVVMTRKVKKVRFSPEHELIEFTRSREIKLRTRKNSVSIRTSSSSLENIDSGGMNGGNVNNQGRVTRFRGLKLMEGQINEKKRGREGVKCHEQINNVSTIENLDNGELREGNLDGTSMILRSRGTKLVEGVKNARNRGKAKEDDKIDTKALDGVDDEKSIGEIVDTPGRLTRSRWQKSTEASVTKTKRVRSVVEIVDNNVPLVSAVTDDNRVVTRRSSRNRERGLGERNNGKGGEEVLEKNGIAEVIEPQILLRISKMNANAVGDSQILNDDTRKHVKGGIKGSRKSAKLLAADGSGVDAESRINKGETDGRVLQIEEPVKLEVRRSNRRKEVIASHEKGRNCELKAETENTYQLRSSVPQSVVVGVMRRSRRKTTILEPVVSDENFDTDAAVENCETEKHLCKEYPVEKGTTAVQKNIRRSRMVASVYKSLEIIDEQKNEARKRKRGPISEGGVVKTNNDPSSLKQFVEESRNEKAVSIVKAQLSVSEGAESTSNPGLNSDTINKNITSDVGLTSSRKTTHTEEHDVSIADSAETKKFINKNKLANSEENVELKTDSADFEKQISASSIQDAVKVDSLEFDVQDIIEQNITYMDKNQFEAQLFNQIKDSSCINTVDNQILQEGLNVSVNEGFVETGSSADSVLFADLEVTEAEADTHTQPGSDVVDHVGEVKGISVQENLDSIETGEANVISSSIARHHNDVDHMEASNSISDDNKGDRASKAIEVGASESCDRCIDSTDSKNASQLKEPSSGKLRSIEGDNADEGDETYFQKGIVSELAEIEKSGNLKDHKIASNEDDEFSVADLFDGERSFRITPQDRGIISGEYSAMKSDEHGMDKESVVVSPITTCPIITNICIERDLESEHTDKGEETCIDKSMKSDEQGMDKESMVVYPITTCPNSTNICLERDLEAEHTGKGEEICIDKSIQLEIAKTDEGGSPVCHKSKCQDDREFITSNILDVERGDKIMPQDREILSGENSIKDFDEKGMEIKLRSGREADQIAEGDEAENNEGGCLNNHKNTKDEYWEFSVSNLFDGEKSDRKTPQDRGISSAEDSNKDFNEQVVFDDFPAVSTMCNEVKISAGSSSLKEISPSGPNSSPKSQGTGPVISDVCEIIDKEAGGATIPEKEVATVQNNIPVDEMSMNKNISDGDHEIFNQADEHTNDYTPKQAEQPKSLSAITTAITNTLGASATTGLAMCMSQTNGKGITSPVVEGSNANEDGNDGNCGKDKDEFADACFTDVDMSMDCTISKLAAESFCELEFHHTEDTQYQFKILHKKHEVSDVGEKPNDVESSQSWTEIELSNLFETTMHDVTPTGVNDTTSQGTEIANPILCINKMDANCGNSLTNKKEKEMEGERGSESAKTTYKTVFLPTNYKEVSDSNPGSGVDSEDNQFKLLFATPTKIDSPFRVELDETSNHEKKLYRADVSITECVGTTKENAVAQIKSDEKVRVAENELENSLCLGSSSDDGEEINYEESNEVESVELVNTSNIVLSETSEEHLTDNTCEFLKKSDFITEENKEEKVISLEESCLYEEARDKVCGLTEKNTNSSSGSLRNLDKLEGCQDMLVNTDFSENISCGNRVCLKSERKVAQSSEAAFELSDADIQKSNVLENTHHLTACYEDSNLSETLIETFKGPMNAKVANIGSFNGISPSLFPKDSNGDDEVTERNGETGDDDDDPYETMMSDEKDDNSKSFNDISDEPHCNTEAEILKSPSVGNNTVELQSRYKVTGAITQNVNNVLPAAEQGFSVRVAEFDVFSSLAVQLLPGDDENGDSEKSEAGTPVYNSEGDHDEKTSKEIEENSTATKVQFSISEVIDSNNDVHSVLREVTDNGNGDIQKSDVGTPLLNLEGDHEKNDKEVEENSTATIVEFPISELHSEEIFIDSNKDVPAFGCNQFLKESDVADTINEYIDSELACINETTAFFESEEDIVAQVVKPEDEDDLQSVESLGTGSKELEEAISVDLYVGGYNADRSSVETKGEEQIKEVLFKESLTGPKTVHTPACVDLVGNSGSAGNDDALLLPQKEEIELEDGHRSSPRQLCSTAKKNARTILIHGTPSKVMTMADMKENAQTHKSSSIGDLTAVRPAKRKAMQDVQWK